MFKISIRVKEYAKGIVAADYWKSYKEMIPADQLLTARANSGNLYNVKMVYGNYGRINASNTSFKDSQTNILQQYNNNYTYNSVNPQSNSFAAESANNNNIMFEYGINGSTKKRTTPTKTECYAFNVFDNFKAYYNSESESFAYYNYDAGGERTYKVVLNNFVSRTNALGNRMLEIEKYMLYPNGFINIDQHGNYTKHYYAETQRIASKIGNGFNDSICGNMVDTADYMEVMKQELGSLNKDTISDIYNPFPQITHLIGDTTSSYEDALFFWHGNNIASTQLITDMHGNVTQAVLYSPHGHIISKYNQDWELDTIIPQYLFQAAEWDEQTRLYLMGVRDFSPDDGIFRSRDRKFEKYFWLSPYNSFANNPLRVIDPTGMIWEDTDGKGKNQEIANRLIAGAEKQVKSYERLQNRIQKKIDKGKGSDETHNTTIEDLKERITLLKDGINGLEEMRKSEQVFAFKEVFKEQGEKCNITRRENGVMDLEYTKDNVAWHESVHAADYLRNPVDYGFDEENRLIFSNGVDANMKELEAYKSEFSFSQSSNFFEKVYSVKDVDSSLLQKKGVWAY